MSILPSKRSRRRRARVERGATGFASRGVRGRARGGRFSPREASRKPRGRLSLVKGKSPESGYFRMEWYSRVAGQRRGGDGADPRVRGRTLRARGTVAAPPRTPPRKKQPKDHPDGDNGTLRSHTGFFTGNIANSSAARRGPSKEPFALSSQPALLEAWSPHYTPRVCQVSQREGHSNSFHEGSPSPHAPHARQIWLLQRENARPQRPRRLCRGGGGVRDRPNRRRARRTRDARGRVPPRRRWKRGAGKVVGGVRIESGPAATQRSLSLRCLIILCQTNKETPLAVAEHP